MKTLDRALSGLTFFFLAAPVLAGPWLFGAWEMWWFWPLAALLAAAAALLGVRLALLPRTLRAGWSAARSAVVPLALCVPFLAYAAVRFAQARVFMDAERAFLLQAMPWVIGAVVVFGLRSAQMRRLLVLIFVNLLLLGLYGIVNHLAFGSRLVMWAPGYEQYLAEHRATGSYFCPDHYAGIMEILFGLALGLALSRDVGGLWSEWERRASWRILAPLGLAVAACGVAMSKSRGGGVSLALVICGAFVLGFSQWRPRVRAGLRLVLLCAVCAGIAALLTVGRPYVTRFVEPLGLGKAGGATAAERLRAVAGELQNNIRYRMAAGAVRAWRASPVFGIGPGMHGALWLHVQDTGDGDRAAGRWPTYPPKWGQNFSPQVHNDWLQLLEEYGLAGFCLFLAGPAGVCAVLLRGLRQEARARSVCGWDRAGRNWYGMIPGALFAGIAMAAHSLVDFNLQMPATVWMLACVTAVPVGLMAREGL